MDRKEFLKIAWRKGIKPIIFIVGILFCIEFMIQILRKGNGQGFLFLFFGLPLLILLLVLLGDLFKTTILNIRSKLPEKVKSFLIVIERILQYIAPVAIGFIIYHYWVVNKWGAVGFFVYLLIYYRVPFFGREQKD